MRTLILARSNSFEGAILDSGTFIGFTKAADNNCVAYLR